VASRASGIALVDDEACPAKIAPAHATYISAVDNQRHIKPVYFRLVSGITTDLTGGMERQRKSPFGLQLLFGDQSIPNSFFNLSVNLKLSGGNNSFFPVDLSVMTTPCL
jgi:hypothetical protein